jgi:transposase
MDVGVLIPHNDSVRLLVFVLKQLNVNPPPSHGTINVFRKHILGVAIESLLYEVVRFLGDYGEVRFTQVFIDRTMVEAQANRHTGVKGQRLPKRGKGYRSGHKRCGRI